MILRHAIRYMELTNSDFITDLKEFAELQRSFVAGYVPDDFTERYEDFTDKLLILWSDCNGTFRKSSDELIELPTQEELINMFCKVVFQSDVEEETETVFFSSSSLLRKKKDDDKNNKTLELLTFLANNEMSIAQYLDMELELIYKVIALVAEKKKEEREKEKKRKRKGM